MTHREVRKRYRQWRSLKRREEDAQQLGHRDVAEELFAQTAQLQREIVNAGWPDPFYMSRGDESFH